MKIYKRILMMALALVMLLSPVPVSAAESGTVQQQAAGHELLKWLPDNPSAPQRPTNLKQMEGSEFGNWPIDWTLGQSKKSVFKEIVAMTDSLTAGKTDNTQKTKAIFDWISQNITYDYVAYGYYKEDKAGKTLTDEQRARLHQAGDPFYSFAQKRAVCDGYSDLSCLMLRVAEIPVAYISGVAFGSDERHAWNAAWLDGKWLFFDATWNRWDMEPDYHTNSEGILCYDGMFEFYAGDDGYNYYVLSRGYTCPSKVTIPDGVIHIGGFENCKTLKSIKLPASLTDIGTSAFEGCTSLTSIVIPANVEYVNENAFKECTKLKKITFRSTKTKVGEDAFINTAWLKKQGDFAITSGILIKYKGSAQKVTIPKGVKSIADYAFRTCLNLQSVTIPKGVTAIGDGAFLQCVELTKVSIPKSVKSIGRNAFAHTPWQKKQGDFVIVNGILLAYQGKNVKKLVVPDGVKEIAPGAFYSFDKVRTISLPASLKKIGADVFGHTLVTKVIFRGTKEQWEAVDIVESSANWTFRDEGTTVIFTG